MDATRELAQLVHRHLELVGRRGEDVAEGGFGVGPELVLRAAELERQCHEPLLRSVVQVALDPSPFLVRRRGEPRPRFGHLLQLCLHLVVEARVLEREAGGSAGGLDELGLVAQSRIVDERCDRLAVVLEPCHRALGPVGRQRGGLPGCVGVCVTLGSPEQHLERRVAERSRELVADPLRRRAAEAEHEIGHRGVGQARTQQPDEHHDRQRDHGCDLPPEEVVEDDRGWPRREGDDAVEDGPQGGDRGREQQRRQDAAGARSRMQPAAGDEEDEDAGEDAVGEDRVRVLQDVHHVGVAVDDEQAVPRQRVEVAELLAAVVEEQDREREDECRRVGDGEKGALEAVGDAAGWIGERDVRDERVADLAQGEEDGERQRVVAVAELARQEREPGRDHQWPERVAGAPRPGGEPREEEGPAGCHARHRARRCRQPERLQVVDLHPVGEHAEHEPGEPEADPGDSHAAASVGAGYIRPASCRALTPLPPTTRGSRPETAAPCG